MDNLTNTASQSLDCFPAGLSYDFDLVVVEQYPVVVESQKIEAPSLCPQCHPLCLVVVDRELEVFKRLDDCAKGFRSAALGRACDHEIIRVSDQSSQFSPVSQPILVGLIDRGTHPPLEGTEIRLVAFRTM